MVERRHELDEGDEAEGLDQVPGDVKAVSLDQVALLELPSPR
jgi:hypothetical protein